MTTQLVCWADVKIQSGLGRYADSISQIGIMIFGCAAIWLVGRVEHWRRWGYILGLCSQPFWFYTAYTHQQWGVVALSCWYSYAWSQGIWNYWIKPLRIAKVTATESDFKS